MHAQRCPASSISSLSSSSADSRLADASSVLLLLARWLRVRALQLRRMARGEMESTGSFLQQTEAGAADSSPPDSFVYPGDLQRAALAIKSSADYAAQQVSTIILSCSDAQEAPPASSTGSGNTAGSSCTAATPLAAMQQVQQQMQELSSNVDSVYNALGSAVDVSCALDAGCYSP
jgi:hypothetical protein